MEILTGVGVLLPAGLGSKAMPDEQPIELAAKVAAAYLRHNPVPADQLGTLISTIHQALAGLGKPAAEPVVERTPAVPIRRSIMPNLVVCMDCGWKGSMLRRHVMAAHGLSVEEYRARWKLPTDHSMIAPAYRERRSTMAKQIGLGRRRATVEIGTVSEAEAAVPDAAPDTPTQAAPKRRGRPRSRATPVAPA